MSKLDLSLLPAGYNAQASRYGFSRSSAPGADVSLDSSGAYAVMTAVVIPLGSYWADRTVGSRLDQIRSLPASAPSQAVAAATAALAPLADPPLNVVRKGSVVVTSSRGRAALGRGNTLFLDVTWKSPDGQSLAVGVPA